MLACGRVAAPRRLSQAISEGDGISLIIEVDGPEAARAAETGGAEALLVLSGHERILSEVAGASSLPILFSFDGQRAEAIDGADACVVEGDEEWLEYVHLNLRDGFELAIRIERDEQIGRVLERFEPEIFVLGAPDPEGRLDHVLRLLTDVPAGKLAIADLGRANESEIAELERAGCDAVLVGAHDPTA